MRNANTDSSPVSQDKQTESEQLIARAKRAQASMRKIAPNTQGGDQEEDPRFIQIKNLVPEALGMSRNPRGAKFKIIGGIGATMSAMHDSPERAKTVHIYNGWEPVLDDDGSIAQHGGDWLLRRPIEFSNGEMKRAQAESDKRLMNQDEEVKGNPLMESFRDAKGEQITAVSTVDASGDV